MANFLFLLLLTAGSGLTACNSSDFAGGSSKGSNKRPDNGGTDQTSAGDADSDADGDSDGNDGNGGKDSGDADSGDDDAADNSDGDIQTEEGEKVDCDNNAEKIAAGNETFAFNTEAEVRTFVNERCKTGISAKFDGAGAVGTDADTAETVCNLKGYKTATVQETGKYSSPHNNFIAYWDKGQTKFILAGASGRNSKIKRLLCAEKFKKQCHDESKKVDCQF